MTKEKRIDPVMMKFRRGGFEAEGEEAADGEEVGDLLGINSLEDEI